MNPHQQIFGGFSTVFTLKVHLYFYADQHAKTIIIYAFLCFVWNLTVKSARFFYKRLLSIVRF